MFTSRQFLAIVALSQASVPVTAAGYTEKVWGVFAYTIHGDSTPNVLAASPESKTLSDYGASQLQAAGSAFRARYVPLTGSLNGSESVIQYLPVSVYSPKNVDVFSTTDQYVVASAQAFMQGLYPPLGQSKMTTANGSSYTYPLNGYQYPRIVTLGDADPTSLVVAGSEKCKLHHVAESEYRDSSYALQTTQETAGYYLNLWYLVLSGIYDKPSATYMNAVDISDYLEYEAVHNSSFRTQISDDELSRARWLADQYVYATNAQDASSASQSTIGTVNPIAGQTLASSLLRAFDMNIQHFGTENQMTLLFGSDEPAVALASLMGLASEQHPNFYSRPARGASLVFELYSFEIDEAHPSFPGIDNLFVRFFLHNGTNSSTTEFSPFPLFGYGPSRTYIPFIEFQSELETFAVLSIQEWCVRCNSQSVFCTGVLGDSRSVPEKKGITPAVGGVIGAVVTLVVIGLAAVIGFLLCGARKREGVHRPSIGGFKGTGKLASDTDVTFRNPIWGASKTADAEQHDEMPAGGQAARGHERLGSWEMGQQRKEVEDIESRTNRPMSDGWDVNEEEWRLHSGLQPVKVRESV